jgi:hypothetical protein
LAEIFPWALNTLCSNTLSLWPSLNVKNQVSIHRHHGILWVWCTSFSATVSRK